MYIVRKLIYTNGDGMVNSKIYINPLKLMLQKRSLVETIFSSSMKCLRTLIHSRHRSPIDAFSHLLAGLINYQLRPHKPVIDKNLFNSLNAVRVNLMIAPSCILFIFCELYYLQTF